MGYVLSGAGAWNDTAPAERRADSALAALQAFSAYVRRDHHPPIRDDAGQLVSLQQVLAEATREASHPRAQQQLAATLADYLDTVLQPWDDAAPYPIAPNSYWRDAGRSWVRVFGQAPPPNVLDELDRRHLCPHRSVLQRGAEEELSRAAAMAAPAESASESAQRRTERARWAGGASSSPPPPASRHGSGRQAPPTRGPTGRR